MTILRRLAATAAAVLPVAVATFAMPTPATAANYVAISGSGSSWSSVALDQWAQDVRPSGLVVNYTPDGSAAGRTDYQANQDDFAASDPPYRDGSDKLGGTTAEHPTVGFSYVPDTAGGTAFMYHLTVAGQQITNLRLSGETLVKIFTGVITNWDDPAITHDYGASLPSLPITPVVRSDGSGATFFLTRWMAHEYPSLWNAFCTRVHPGISLPCNQTEFYPTSGWGNVKAQNGSNNVATYITSSYGNGSIGYDEYAYALNAHYPVVKVLNPAGYYVLPTASNVAVALTKAIINEDQHSTNFLQQDLDSVYTFTDARSYPLSSYSYLIVPRTGTQQPTNFTPARGSSLSTYITYALCAGQQQMAALGYSPLPLNLVQGGLQQVDQIPGHGPTPNPVTLAGCDNPTFTNGVLTLLRDAPYPSACDKVGTPLNCVLKNGKPNSGKNPKATTGGATPGSGSTSVSPGAAGPAPTATQGGPVTGVTVSLASANRSSEIALATITAASIIAAVAVPPVLAAWLRRRRQHD